MLTVTFGMGSANLGIDDSARKKNVYNSIKKTRCLMLFLTGIRYYNTYRLYYLNRYRIVQRTPCGRLKRSKSILRENKNVFSLVKNIIIREFADSYKLSLFFKIKTDRYYHEK